jgi:hypothetical protein
MTNDRRVYSEEEFALILRKAAELAEPTDPSSPASSGLTLAEMKAAAAQVGFDPALVERAARLLATDSTASPSFMARVMGGPSRHGAEAHFPVVLDEVGTAKLLSAIRIGVGRSGDGHSSAFGMTWRSSDDGGSVLGLTARTDRGGTSVTADLDRRGTVMFLGGMTATAGFMAFFFGGTVADELFPGYGLGGAVLGFGSVLALARSYWASSTRTARDRLGRVMDTVGRFLAQAEDTASGDDRDRAPEP